MKTKKENKIEKSSIPISEGKKKSLTKDTSSSN